VTVVCPESGLNEEVAYRVAQKEVSHIDRNFEPHDLDNADMVLCAIDDPEASTQVWKLCKERRIPSNIADVPSECDFFFGSMHRDGPLQVMVSTNGNGPKLANIVRQNIANTLPQNTGAAIENVGLLRKKLREIAPDAHEGPKRMKWLVLSSSQYLYEHGEMGTEKKNFSRMSNVCVSWTLEDLVAMTEKDMDALLGHYQSGNIPNLQEIRETSS
jgi:precorrin-2 dehydrogenase / sirohydrochlorin ferrochelatase